WASSATERGGRLRERRGHAAGAIASYSRNRGTLRSSTVIIRITTSPPSSGGTHSAAADEKGPGRPSTGRGPGPVGRGAPRRSLRRAGRGPAGRRASRRRAWASPAGGG